MAEMTNDAFVKTEEYNNRQSGGFNFDLYKRDAKLAGGMNANGQVMPAAMKTGYVVFVYIFYISKKVYFK